MSGVLPLALDGKFAFLATHQPSVAWCFNNNMLRVAQAGLVGELSYGVWPTAADGAGMPRNCACCALSWAESGGGRADWVVLGRVACDGADVIVLLEDDSDGEERVKVTGVVDCEVAGAVPREFPDGADQGGRRQCPPGLGRRRDGRTRIRAGGSSRTP
jgi:hypothetical protein